MRDAKSKDPPYITHPYTLRPFRPNAATIVSVPSRAFPRRSLSSPCPSTSPSHTPRTLPNKIMGTVLSPTSTASTTSPTVALFPDEAKIPFTPQLAFDYMEQGTAAWTAESKCIACHTNGSYMVVRPMLTPQLGPPQSEMRDFFLSELKADLAVAPAKRQTDVEPTQLVYIAAGLPSGTPTSCTSSFETAQALDLMFQMQRDTGDWHIGDDNNPPLESNTYQLATVAARAIGNAPGWLAQQHGKPVEARINKLKAFLRAEQKPQGDYDRTDLLWASAEQVPWPAAPPNASRN